MTDLFRETAFGQLVRLVSQGRLLRYPEELRGFEYKYPEASKPDISTESPLRTVSPSETDPEKAEIDTGTGGTTTPNGGTLNLKDTVTLVDWYGQGQQKPR